MVTWWKQFIVKLWAWSLLPQKITHHLPWNAERHSMCFLYLEFHHRAKKNREAGPPLSVSSVRPSASSPIHTKLCFTADSRPISSLCLGPTNYFLSSGFLTIHISSISAARPTYSLCLDLKWKEHCITRKNYVVQNYVTFCVLLLLSPAFA